MASLRPLNGPRCIVRQLQRPYRAFHTAARLSFSHNASSNKSSVGSREIKSTEELESVFAEPTWSMESLLPPGTPGTDAPKISSQQLHHLLRLSALPIPENAEQEKKMLDTLSAQLHFVGEIQQVDTAGVTPLRAIRDETLLAEQEQTITLETLKGALAKEKVIGKHYKRIQRDATPVDAREVEDWDVLGSAERKAGKYFVVESERPSE